MGAEEAALGTAWASSPTSLGRASLGLHFVDSPGAPKAPGKRKPLHSTEGTRPPRLSTVGVESPREEAVAGSGPGSSCAAEGPSRPGKRGLRGGCPLAEGGGRCRLHRGGSRGGGRCGAPGSPRGGPTSSQAEARGAPAVQG